MDSVYLPIGELQTSSKAAEEMQKLGLRHLHNERKMENGRKGVGRETGAGEGRRGCLPTARPHTFLQHLWEIITLPTPKKHSQQILVS